MNLDFSVTESSDNTKITITDTTEDWAAGDIQDVYDNGAATITPTILGTEYDSIDVSSYFNGGDQDDLAFEITASDLKIDGTSPFESGDEMPDGDYSIVYAANHTNGGATSDSVTDLVLITGVIEKSVLDALLLTEVTPLTFEETLKDAMIRLAQYSYLKGIENSAYVSEISNLRTALTNLESMVSNGNY